MLYSSRVVSVLQGCDLACISDSLDLGLGFFWRYTCCSNTVKLEQLDMQQTSLLFLTDQDKIVKRENQT